MDVSFITDETNEKLANELISTFSLRSKFRSTIYGLVYTLEVSDECGPAIKKMAKDVGLSLIAK